MIENDDIPENVRAEIIQAAEKAAPNEMCGFVAAMPDYEFWQCENIAPNPQQTFEMDWDFMTYYDGMVAAIVHSHPRGEPFLSGADRQAQVATDLPWILAVCRPLGLSGSLKVFRPVPHLRGREFEYDEMDCCRLIQDAYHLCGLDLPDYPRLGLDEDIAAQTLLNYFENNHEFSQVDDVQAGDIVLTQFGKNTPEHALLYLGDDEMLHHAHNQLSRIDIYSGYWQKHTHSVWRHQKWQPEMLAAIRSDLLHCN